MTALLALKPITARNTSPVCQCVDTVGSDSENTHCHNCKMFAEALVADSAVPIWNAPPFWDYLKKSSHVQIQ